MSTDTNVTKKLRDINPETIVTVAFNGTPDTGYTSESFLQDHDAAIVEARREGAEMMLDKMENILYQLAASGDFDDRPEYPPNYAAGVQYGAKVQLESARDALDKGLVDFTK